LDYLKDIPIVGDQIGEGAQQIRETAQTFREVGQDNRDTGGNLLGPAVDRATERMSEAFSNIGKALSEGFDRGSSLIDTSGLQQHLDDSIGSVMERVQNVSQQSREAVETKKPQPGGYDEELDRKTKPAASALQRIGGGGYAQGSGDPVLREQQRQTRELS